MKDNLSRARRVALVAALVTMAMAVGKYVVGLIVGSRALQADALHSGIDMIALGTSWFGLYIAGRRPTERFPYGFYRAETLAAMVGSGVIILLGGHFALESVRRVGTPREVQFSAAGLAVAAISVFVALGLYVWEKRTSVATGSQSLGATAEEVKLDMGTSAAVFVALLCSRYRIPYVEGIVTLAISALVLYAGFGSMRTAVLSLMDASVDPELEGQVARIIADVPGVRGVEQIRSRRSGPFYFVEGHVDVKPRMDVERSHALAHRAAEAVRERLPRIEGVVLHIEPWRGRTQTVLVPVESDDGLDATISTHFGRSPFFLVAHLDGDELQETAVEENTLRDRSLRVGLGVIRTFLKEHDLDAVLLREIGEIAFHGLRDDAVGIYRAPEGSARGALEQYAAHNLELLPDPTHSSEERVEEGDRP
jgi:cation diffusion facilitator family transporter